MPSIRKRRRDRTRRRIANQKRLDAIAYKKLNGNMTTSFDTWGGSRCPECNKPLPSRAFCAGHDVDFIIAGFCQDSNPKHMIMSVGSSVSPEFCHEDKTRCHSESAKHDASIWKLANAYIPTKKELKERQKYREYLERKRNEING